jgi:hypothetical protein
MGKIRKILAVILTFVVMIPSVHAEKLLNYVACGEVQSIPKPVPALTSLAFHFLLIATPLILIAFSIIALIKAITAGKADDIMKAKSKLIKKIIATILVFFVAGIVQFVVSRAADGSEKGTITACLSCFLYNSGCEESNNPIPDPLPTNSYNPPSNTNTVSGTSSNSGSSTNPGSNTNSGSTTNPGSSVPPPTGNGASAKAYTNPQNGLTFTVYSQGDSRWASKAYPKGGTVGSRGCMVTSVAVAASAFDSSVTPGTVFDTHRHHNPYDSIAELTKGKFDCMMESRPSKTAVANSLNDGGIVVVKVFGKSKGGSSPYTTSQHYMALIGINGDQVFVGNSYSSTDNGRSGWHSIDRVLISVQTAEICKPR